MTYFVGAFRMKQPSRLESKFLTHFRLSCSWDRKFVMISNLRFAIVEITDGATDSLDIVLAGLVSSFNINAVLAFSRTGAGGGDRVGVASFFGNRL